MQTIATIIGAFITIVVTVIRLIKPSKHTKALAGIIIDENNHAAVDHAEITVVGQAGLYYSEQNGNFRIVFNNKKLTQVKIRVIRKGFRPFEMTYDLPNENVKILLKAV